MLKDVYASEDLNDTTISDTNTQSDAMTSSINSKLVDLFGTSDLKESNSNRSTGGQTLDIPKDIFEKTKDPEWKKANREKYEYKYNAPTSKLQEMLSKNNINLKSENTLFNIPDQVSSILSSDENDFDNLSDLERQRIRDAKKQGLKITGRMMSDLKTNLDAATEEGYGLQNKQFLSYLNDQRIDFAMLDEKVLREYGEKYKKDRRPPIHILIKFTLTKINEKLIDILSKVEIATDEQKLIFIESQEARDEFVRSITSKGQQVFDYDDFDSVKYYFDQYGLHQDDVDRLNPDNIVKEGVSLQDYYDVFKIRSGYDFVDIYTHFADLHKNKDSTINDSNFVNREDIDDINLKGNNPNAPAPEIETNVDLRYTEVEVTEVLEF